MDNYTSIDQSKRLLELGLDSETADMMYVQHQPEPVIKNDCFAIEFDTPCWSVGALLDLMPVSIAVGNQSCGDDTTWICKFMEPGSNGISVDKESKRLVEVCYNMVCYLLENNFLQNNYIKTE